MRTTPRTRATLRRLLRSDRGAELVETALTFPLLILVVLGLMELAMLMYSYATVKHSALVGLRAATVERTPADTSVVRAVRASAFGLQLADSSVVVRVNGGNKLFEAREMGDSLEVSVSFLWRPMFSQVLETAEIPIRTSARGVMF